MTARSALQRVLLYSHDTYGLGHLRRNLVLAAHLLSGDRPPRVVLASGSPVIDRIDRPRGLDCVQLPPVVKTGEGEYQSLDPSLGISLVRRARSAVLLDVVSRWRPDVLLVDHAPQGMKGELLPVFEALARCSPGTRVVLGLRDILDDPERVRATWRSEGVYDTLASVYDRILVYGSRDVFDLASAYRIPEPVASRLEYCGYVTGDRAARAVRPPGIAPGERYVLGTVGGGGDGTEVLTATARAASALGTASVLCTGPLMSRGERQRLERLASSLGRTVVVEHLRSVAQVAAGAQAVVTRGGYNSLCELVPLGVPTIVVPRARPRLEQVLRARVFAASGLVRVVDGDGHDLAGRLAGELAQAPARSASPTGLDLRGRERVVASLEELVGDRVTRFPAPPTVRRAEAVGAPA